MDPGSWDPGILGSRVMDPGSGILGSWDPGSWISGQGSRVMGSWGQGSRDPGTQVGQARGLSDGCWTLALSKHPPGTPATARCPGRGGTSLPATAAAPGGRCLPALPVPGGLSPTRRAARGSAEPGATSSCVHRPRCGRCTLGSRTVRTRCGRGGAIGPPYPGTRRQHVVNAYGTRTRLLRVSPLHVASKTPRARVRGTRLVPAPEARVPGNVRARYPPRCSRCARARAHIDHNVARAREQHP